MTEASRTKTLTSISAIFAAAAMAAPLVLDAEGWALRTYKDPVGIVTDCAGNTKGAVMGVVRTEAQCQQRLAEALVEHGFLIAPYITVDVPVPSRAAFTSFAYNAGSAKFAGSTMLRKLNAGDLAGACAELSKWTFAGGKQLPGLVTRRARERALCEKGLT